MPLQGLNNELRIGPAPMRLLATKDGMHCLSLPPCILHLRRKTPSIHACTCSLHSCELPLNINELRCACR